MITSISEFSAVILNGRVLATNCAFDILNDFPDFRTVASDGLLVRKFL